MARKDGKIEVEFGATTKDFDTAINGIATMAKLNVDNLGVVVNAANKGVGAVAVKATIALQQLGIELTKTGAKFDRFFDKLNKASNMNLGRAAQQARVGLGQPKLVKAGTRAGAPTQAVRNASQTARREVDIIDELNVIATGRARTRGGRARGAQGENAVEQLDAVVNPRIRTGRAASRQGVMPHADIALNAEFGTGEQKARVPTRTREAEIRANNRRWRLEADRALEAERNFRPVDAQAAEVLNARFSGRTGTETDPKLLDVMLAGRARTGGPASRRVNLQHELEQLSNRDQTDRFFMDADIDDDGDPFQPLRRARPPNPLAAEMLQAQFGTNRRSGLVDLQDELSKTRTAFELMAQGRGFAPLTGRGVDDLAAEKLTALFGSKRKSKTIDLATERDKLKLFSNMLGTAKFTAPTGRAIDPFAADKLNAQFGGVGPSGGGGKAPRPVDAQAHHILNKKFGGSTEEVTEAVKKSTGGFSKLDRMLSKVLIRVGVVATAIRLLAEAFRGMGAIVNAVAESERFTDMLSTFVEMSDNSGTAMDTLGRTFANLGGTVDKFTIAQGAAQARMGGLAEETIPKLALAARIMSRAVGVDAPQAFDRLTRGIAKQEVEILDELGIIVRLNDSLEAYARANNKTVASLTAQERQIAFTNEVLNKMSARFRQIGVDTDRVTDDVARMKAEWNDLSLVFGASMESTGLWLARTGLGFTRFIANSFGANDALNETSITIRLLNSQFRHLDEELGGIFQEETLTVEEFVKKVQDLTENVRNTTDGTIEHKNAVGLLNEALGALALLYPELNDQLRVSNLLRADGIDLLEDELDKIDALVKLRNKETIADKSGVLFDQVRRREVVASEQRQAARALQGAAAAPQSERDALATTLRMITQELVQIDAGLASTSLGITKALGITDPLLARQFQTVLEMSGQLSALSQAPTLDRTPGGGLGPGGMMRRVDPSLDSLARASENLQDMSSFIEALAAENIVPQDMAGKFRKIAVEAATSGDLSAIKAGATAMFAELDAVVISMMVRVAKDVEFSSEQGRADHAAALASAREAIAVAPGRVARLVAGATASGAPSVLTEAFLGLTGSGPAPVRESVPTFDTKDLTEGLNEAVKELKTINDEVVAAEQEYREARAKAAADDVDARTKIDEDYIGDRDSHLKDLASGNAAEAITRASGLADAEEGRSKTALARIATLSALAPEKMLAGMEKSADEADTVLAKAVRETLAKLLVVSQKAQTTKLEAQREQAREELKAAGLSRDMQATAFEENVAADALAAKERHETIVASVRNNKKRGRDALNVMQEGIDAFTAEYSEIANRFVISSAAFIDSGGVNFADHEDFIEKMTKARQASAQDRNTDATEVLQANQVADVTGRVEDALKATASIQTATTSVGAFVDSFTILADLANTRSVSSIDGLAGRAIAIERNFLGAERSLTRLGTSMEDESKTLAELQTEFEGLSDSVLDNVPGVVQLGALINEGSASYEQLSAAVDGARGALLLLNDEAITKLRGDARGLADELDSTLTMALARLDRQFTSLTNAPTVISKVQDALSGRASSSVVFGAQDFSSVGDENALLDQQLQLEERELRLQSLMQQTMDSVVKLLRQGLSPYSDGIKDLIARHGELNGQLIETKARLDTIRSSFDAIMQSIRDGQLAEGLQQTLRGIGGASVEDIERFVDNLGKAAKTEGLSDEQALLLSNTATSLEGIAAAKTNIASMNAEMERTQALFSGIDSAASSAVSVINQFTGGGALGGMLNTLLGAGRGVLGRKSSQSGFALQQAGIGGRLAELAAELDVGGLDKPRIDAIAREQGLLGKKSENLETLATISNIASTIGLVGQGLQLASGVWSLFNAGAEAAKQRIREIEQAADAMGQSISSAISDGFGDGEDSFDQFLRKMLFTRIADEIADSIFQGSEFAAELDNIEEKQVLLDENQKVFVDARRAAQKGGLDIGGLLAVSQTEASATNLRDARQDQILDAKNVVSGLEGDLRAGNLGAERDRTVAALDEARAELKRLRLERDFFEGRRRVHKVGGQFNEAVQESVGAVGTLNESIEGTTGVIEQFADALGVSTGKGGKGVAGIATATFRAVTEPQANILVGLTVEMRDNLTLIERNTRMTAEILGGDVLGALAAQGANAQNQAAGAPSAQQASVNDRELLDEGFAADGNL